MGNLSALRAMETPHVATAGVSKCPRTTTVHDPPGGGFRVPKQGVPGALVLGPGGQTDGRTINWYNPSSA